MSEDDLFAQMMGDKVQPIKKENRVQTQKPKNKHAILRNLENKEVFVQQVSKHKALSPQRTEDWLLRADGVASKDIKKLAQTNVSHEIDLHGLTQKEAITALSEFFNHALAQNIRQVCVVHGKGNHSKGKSVLKDTTYHWLEHGPFSSSILTATPATQSKGGACNILLRKQNN